MEALREVTGGQFHPHVYLLDGSTLIAYKKWGTEEPYYFKQGIKGFDKRGRKFEAVKPSPFTVKKVSSARAVLGSKGETYYVDDEAKTCTCAGYTFRGACKHLG